MGNINGMTKDDWKTFQDMLKKANTGQIQVMAEEIDKEEQKRMKRLHELAGGKNE
jgi:rubrerythrin